MGQYSMSIERYLQYYDYGADRDQYYLKKIGRYMVMPKNHKILSIRIDRGKETIFCTNDDENPNLAYINFDKAIARMKGEKNEMQSV